MLTAIANHLWQSTVFAVVAALLASSLRKNRAEVRHWIWLAASVKFLIPFSLLVSVGSRIDWRPAIVAAPAPVARAMDQAHETFAPVAAEPLGLTPEPSRWSYFAASLWFLGFCGVAGLWGSRWLRMRAAVRTAEPMDLAAPTPVMCSKSEVEPGVFGILRPVLMLPEGIAERLSSDQLRAVLAHEFCHVRRRDNLAAAVQTVVEAVFWFHPLVWWLGARMVEERERACDEDVLLLGSQPEVYAEGILNVCRFYLQSPAACVSGITGSELKKRIESILTSGLSQQLSAGRKLLLACAAMAAVAVPVLIGVWTAPLSIAQNLVFEVASIKPAAPNQENSGFNIQPGEKLRARNITLHRLIAISYDVRDFQVTGGPEWMKSLTWDILATPDHPRPDIEGRPTKRERDVRLGEIRQRVRNLLAERFQLAFHRETKEVPVYALVAAKGGSKLKTADHENESMG